MTEPVKITFRLEDEDQAGQPKPAPRADRQPDATDKKKTKEELEEERYNELFHSSHDEWYGHYETSFRKTRRSQEYRYAGESLGRLMRGDVRGAGKSLLHNVGLKSGESAAATNVASGLMGAGAGVKMAAGAGLAVGGLMKLAEWTEKSSNALEVMAQKAKGFSADVALAEAQRDVKRTMFEMGQAEKYGPQLAAQVQARTDLGIEFDRLKNGLEMAVAPLTTAVVEAAANVFEGFNKLIGLKDKNEDEYAAMRKELGKNMEAMLELQKDANRLMAEADMPDGMAGVEQWMNQPNPLDLRAKVVKPAVKPQRKLMWHPGFFGS